jgi:hypothetical protein
MQFTAITRPVNNNLTADCLFFTLVTCLFGKVQSRKFLMILLCSSIIGFRGIDLVIEVAEMKVPAI